MLREFPFCLLPRAFRPSVFCPSHLCFLFYFCFAFGANLVNNKNGSQSLHFALSGGPSSPWPRLLSPSLNRRPWTMEKGGTGSGRGTRHHCHQPALGWCCCRCFCGRRSSLRTLCGLVDCGGLLFAPR